MAIKDNLSLLLLPKSIEMVMLYHNYHQILLVYELVKVQNLILNNLPSP